MQIVTSAVRVLCSVMKMLCFGETSSVRDLVCVRHSGKLIEDGELSHNLQNQIQVDVVLRWRADGDVWRRGPVGWCQRCPLTPAIGSGGHKIQRYHSVQILELSMQGFLSNLGSDLYLFEILQNAVDDGALNVRFQVTSKFEQRTIGFMCIGLKLVYKRFSPATGSFGWCYSPSGKCARDPQGALAVVPASFCVAHAVSYVPSVKSVGCGPLTLSERVYKEVASCVVPPNPLTRIDNGNEGLSSLL